MARQSRLALVVAVGLPLAAGPLAVGSVPASAATLVGDPAALVNPMIGTGAPAGRDGDIGNTSPAATAPFGMVQWGPDTTPMQPGGGYNFAATKLTGFGVDRMSGAGCFAFGHLPFLPVTGAVPTDRMNATVGFSHANETAAAGSYAVTLANGVRTELTASARAGLGRFDFPAGVAATLLVKAAGGAAVSRAAVSAPSTTEVVGSVSAGAFCARITNYTLFFAVQFDRPFTAATKWGPPPLASGDGGVALSFPAGSDVRAKVGLSYVSIQNAQANRATLAGWDLAATRASTKSAWNGLLSRVQIGGGTSSQQRVFYTALYHSLLHPNLYSDANRQYRGFDGVVRTLPAGQGDQYANFSGWDTYRSQVQLSALLAPRQTSDMVSSMLNDFDHSGRLPKWPLANVESYMMVGDPALPLIAGAYAFGARSFDTARALAAMVRQASRPGNVRPGNVYLDTLGYLPDDGGYGCCFHTGTVSTSLEYNVADHALAAFAGALGDGATRARFLDRAQGWQYLVNPASGFVQPRHASGQWRAGFDPTDWSQDDWSEGNSWKYTPMVPFNARGLIAAKGGNAAMVAYLDSHFQRLNEFLGPWATMGNEPSFGAPWLYAYAGAPYKTQQVVRRIQTELFRDAPDGLPGNDDLGSMSSWYVWSALGFYPAVAGTADLVLGSPLFPQAEVQLPAGGTLTIDAPAAAASSPYVQSMTVGGAVWDRAFLPPSILATGGTVHSDLGGAPNPSWAAGPGAAPPSYGANAMASAGNNGSSDDAAAGQGNFDGIGASYSAQALAAAGVVPGSRVVAGGVAYTWPNVRPGQADNVVAAGQRLTVAGAPGSSRIGFLGAAEGAPDGAGGGATVHYASGADQPVPLAFSDWTLAAGSRAVRSDNTVAAAMPYRNNVWSEGGREQVGTHVFSASFDIDPARAVVGVTLPASVTAGRLHVFAVGLGGHRNSAGVGDDSYPGGADFDGVTYSYSRQALAAAGLGPGTAVTHGGIRYLWPNTAAGERDNHLAVGQTLAVTPVAGATRIGLLGGAEGWPTGASGPATIAYSDGTRQQVTLGFTDWTRAAGSQPIGFGNTVVAQTPYRNSALFGREQTPAYVFAATFPLLPGKTPRSITLPATVTGGRLHVFSVGTA